MLSRLRKIVASIVLLAAVLLFLDFTGTAARCVGWLAKLQFLPALLAVNVAVVVGVVALTLLLGRIYCSVLCPLGIMQDVVSWLSARRKKKHFRFRHSPEKKWLRYGVFAAFAAAMLIGVNGFVALLAPYSSFGRMMNNLFSPIYAFVNNNVFAALAELFDSYAFYRTEPAVFVLSSFVVASFTFAIIVVLAWRNGRTYCNTICPVGTLLSFFARFSVFRPAINTDKCVSCHKCERSCKSSCIDVKNHKIDYSRCVTCFDCVSACGKQGAISYTFAGKSRAKKNVDEGRRGFLAATGALLSVAVANAQKKTDGGLAAIVEKNVPERKTKVTPPGSLSAQHLARHCTACQLCISQCPNKVLRPSSNLSTFMQPEMSFEKGACRPECTRCSEVCPTNAITKITREEKSSIQIGHAVWVKKNCVVLADGVTCGNCAKHCPVGAIQMVPVPANILKDVNSKKSTEGETEQPQLMIPVVNTEQCIGCGTCENLCPATPYSAIYVEGHEKHREV